MPEQKDNRNNIEKSLSDVLEAVTQTQRITFLLGAGISVNAGIPTAHGIICRAAKELLGADDVDNAKVLAWLKRQPFFDPNDAYASVLDSALPSKTERATYFEKLIAGSQPTLAHKNIAKLINLGYASIVTTTNFDRLMEYAVVGECGHMPAVLQTDDFPDYLDLHSGRAKILKLHGDYLYGNIKNLDHELHRVKESMVQKLRIASNEGAMVVAGYSGGDASVMETLKNITTDKAALPGGLFWLNLRGNSLRSEVITLLAKANSSSGTVHVDGCDEFFSEMVSKLPKKPHKEFPSLGNRAHLSTLKDNELEPFVSQRLDKVNTTYFVAQLKRKHEIQDFCQTQTELDFLLACYEEYGEVPKYIGQLVDRYIDLLSGGTLQAPSPISKNKYSLRITQLVALDLAEKNEGKIVVKEKTLEEYLYALKLVDDKIDYSKIKELLNTNEQYAVLRSYVGLIPDATAIIRSAVNATAGVPGLYGRRRPWPEGFYKAASLIGFANYVNANFIELIVDLLAMEFDTERWHPIKAVKAIASIGNPVIKKMIAYLLDSLQDTFSREDAALVLGEIGSRKVVESLEASGHDLSPRDAKFVIYALGLTRNSNAINAVSKLAAQVAKPYQFVIDEALGRLGYEGPQIKAEKKEEEPSQIPVIDTKRILKKYCPNLDNGSSAQLYLNIYLKNPSKFTSTIEAIGLWPSDLRMLITMGQSLRNQGELWNAEVLIAECLDRYPMIHHIYHDLALVYSRQKRYMAARRYYVLALSLEPDYVDFYNDFAVTMLELNNLDAARYLLIKAISVDPNNYRPWYNLAAVNLKIRNKGSTNLKKNIPTDEGGRIFFGESDLEDANFEDARICLQQVLVLNPNHHMAGNQLQTICSLIGELPEGKPNQQELVSVLHLGETELGGGVSSEGWPEAAFEAIKKGEKLRYKGDFEGAVVAVKEAFRIYPDSPDIMHNLSLLLSQLERNDEAIRIQETALSKFPWNRQLLMNYSSFLRKAKRYNEAIIAAQKAIRVNAKMPAVWITLAQTYFEAGKIPQARDALQEAIMLSPPWSWELLHSVDLCKQLGIKDAYIW